MTTITKEQLHERARRKVKELEFAITQSAFTSIRDGLEEKLELARIALASLNATPIYQVQYGQRWRDVSKEVYEDHRDHGSSTRIVYAEPPASVTGIYDDILNIIGLLENNEWAEHCTSTVLGSLLESEITRLVGKEQPASERERIRREHAEWSDKTFGDVGPVGPLKHLSKEALEAAAEPDDLSEWADMQFLLWDAQRRAGITDKQITLAMVDKLAVNKKREWPVPKDGEPRLHIKEQSAPVVPEEITDESTEQRLMGRRWAHSFCAGWNACRAAMLSGGKS